MDRKPWIPIDAFPAKAAAYMSGLERAGSARWCQNSAPASLSSTSVSGNCSSTRGSSGSSVAKTAASKERSPTASGLMAATAW